MMDFSKGILIASSNKNKVREIKEIFTDTNINFYSLSDLNLKELAVVESGRTFKENAYIKAKTYAKEYNKISLSDDSGLEVDYLGGEPGVHSARYAGANSTNDDLINKLLSKLDGVNSSQRTARFRSVICIYDPIVDDCIYSEGVCEGYISDKKLGTNGFGYDPIFKFKNLDKTMAQLSSNEKNQISHRFKALDALKIAFTELFNK